ncbi:hypothetical protein B0I35DRAFT_444750 [Stachybotrys elegans]|uniref:ribonuclease H n=1 Tax=Stachybotrys elegans TaxID=80388 RepID=A0A8K0SAE4_9HYPO|nr:hypothetical protein B0I35DRAFT_444750 [Stachybotrys elegans]
MDYSNIIGRSLYGRYAAKGCFVCNKREGTLRCSGCRVINYCGRQHQASHRPRHKAACQSIKKTREKLESETAILQAFPGDVFTPSDLFNTGVGLFWGITETRDYMRARFAAAEALIHAATPVAVGEALAHFTDMLRLCRSDNLGVRDIIPNLLLRLGREQECYDFLKWWAVIGSNSKYDWSNTTLPYLDIHNADAFEPVDVFRSMLPDLSHVVTLTLLKLRMLLDLQALESSFEDIYGGSNGLDLDSSDESDIGMSGIDRPLGKLVRARFRGRGRHNISGQVKILEAQYHKLCDVVHQRNPYFWETLVDEADDLPRLPQSYTMGSLEEAELAVRNCRQAWIESEDAVLMVSADTRKFARPHQGVTSRSVVKGVGALPRSFTGGSESLKRPFTGSALPTRFSPPSPTSSPIQLFPATSCDATPAGLGRATRFICVNDKEHALVYVDGACMDNGQQNSQAGWAAVRGPPEGSGGNRDHKVSGRLEDHESLKATSNRAELYAALSALRLFNWSSEGFTRLVITTDSSYVVDGATGWVKSWLRNGWTKTSGGDVKNKDLWEQFLGEIEWSKNSGLSVQLWNIPRELNSEADTAAKAAARSPGQPKSSGSARNASSGFGAADAGKLGRFLGIALDFEPPNELLRGLVSQVTAKVSLEWATTQESALSLLTQRQPLSVILITDAALTRRRKVWDAVIDQILQGATAVITGFFSTMSTSGEFDRFFARLGLPWEKGSYYRATMQLNRNAVDHRVACHLPFSCNQKVVYVKNVDSSAVWYTDGSSSEAGIAFAQVGKGRLGYIGDVNFQQESHIIALAMCGLLG